MDEIQYLNMLEIQWEIKIGDGDWKAVGSSFNPGYITWDDPLLTKNTWTVLHTGCVAANGTGGTKGTDDDKVLDKIWAKLKGLSIPRASDGKILSY